MKKFIELCVSGEAEIDRIDDYIDAWHEGNSEEELHEFLGLSKNEYEAYIKNPFALPQIVAIHKDAPLTNLIENLVDKWAELGKDKFVGNNDELRLAAIRYLYMKRNYLEIPEIIVNLEKLFSGLSVKDGVMASNVLMELSEKGILEDLNSRATASTLFNAVEEVKKMTENSQGLKP